MSLRPSWLWIPLALVLTAAIPCQALLADRALQSQSEWLAALNAHAICTMGGLQAGTFPAPAVAASAGPWVAFSGLSSLLCPHCLALTLLALVTLWMLARTVGAGGFRDRGAAQVRRVDSLQID